MKTQKNSKVQFRQGDVMIERIAALPDKRTEVKRENGKIVLAHGEVTGHAHAIADADCALFETETEPGVTFLEVQEAMAMLTHEEHATIQIPAGTYRVTRQREYTPQAIRRVAD